MNVVTGEASSVAKNALNKYNKSVAENPAFSGYLVPCPDADAVRKISPRFTGKLPGWKGYLNRLAGYAHSSNAMQSVFEECVTLGVTFKLGPDGEVDELLYAPGTKKCIGARTKNGTVYYAATTIVATGGFVASVIPAIAGQVTAVCWGVSHIQLTPEECEKLRGMPVTSVRDIGFFFEPDPATHKFKICFMGGGYTRLSSSSSRPNERVSLPFSTLTESGYVPEEDVRQTRRLLRQVLPHIAERPLIDTHLCWIADTSNSDFIIDFVPGSDNSLVVLSGDSGHGFKFMPVFGGWVNDLLTAGKQKLTRWRWKDVEAGGNPTQVAWRASETVDLSTAPRAKL